MDYKLISNRIAILTLHNTEGGCESNRRSENAKIRESLKSTTQELDSMRPSVRARRDGNEQNQASVLNIEATRFIPVDNGDLTNTIDVPASTFQITSCTQKRRFCIKTIPQNDSSKSKNISISIEFSTAAAGRGLSRGRTSAYSVIKVRTN